MKTIVPVAAALIATAALSTSVYALDHKASVDKTIEQDVNRLSKDGFKAMMDVREARLAIFNAQPDKAKTEIEDAQKALVRAKTDDTAFMKAEAALKAPGNAKQPTAQADASASTTPVAWLPISGALGIDEDFSGSPAKVSGVAKANGQLKAGQQKEALETLRLNDINLSFVMQVAPLDKTTQGVNQAAQLINSGKYYEANQVLKTIEDGVRFDVVDVSAVPKTNGAQATGTRTPAPAATTGANTSAPQATPSPMPDKK
jgi:hypothetical protein